MANLVGPKINQPPVGPPLKKAYSLQRRNVVKKMASNESLLLIVLLLKKMRQKAKKMHIHITYYTLFDDVFAVDNTFFNYFGMLKA